MLHKIKVHWMFRCLLTIVYAAAIFLVSSKDTSRVPLFPHVDKVIHGIEFGILCTLICWSISSGHIGAKSIYRIALPITLASIYGATDEYHQSFTPHRSVEFLDWVADTTGATIACFTWQALSRRRRGKEKSLAMDETMVKM
ncbi:MAG: VanZ family protein [Planctomycetes bacterium]|nr:VanZ family protein [Planctomycetota bacterium]